MYSRIWILAIFRVYARITSIISIHMMSIHICTSLEYAFKFEHTFQISTKCIHMISIHVCTYSEYVRAYIFKMYARICIHMRDMCIYICMDIICMDTINIWNVCSNLNVYSRCVLDVSSNTHRYARCMPNFDTRNECVRSNLGDVENQTKT